MTIIGLNLLRGSASCGAPHGTRSRSRPGPAQLCTENGQALRGQRMEERFQDHLGLAKTSIEVIVERIELFPAGGGLNGQAGNNLVGVLFKLHSEMLDGVRENAKLMKKPRAVPEQYVVQKAVPGCCALSGVSPEKLRVQRLHEREIGYVLSAF